MTPSHLVGDAHSCSQGLVSSEGCIRVPLELHQVENKEGFSPGYSYCEVMKIGCPALQHVVGLETEPLNGVCRSDDLVYLDVSQWTEEDAEEACRIQREMRILASPKITHVHESEYPILR